MYSVDVLGLVFKLDMCDGYGVSVGCGIVYDEIWWVYLLLGLIGWIYV